MIGLGLVFGAWFLVKSLTALGIPQAGAGDGPLPAGYLRPSWDHQSPVRPQVTVSRD